MFCLSVQITMNTSDIFSTSNTTTEAAAVDVRDSYDQFWLDLEWWVSQTLTNFALPILGGIGNILTIIVMQRGSLKDVSTCFYMSVLAVADTGKYITEVIRKYLFLLLFFKQSETIS